MGGMLPKMTAACLLLTFLLLLLVCSATGNEKRLPALVEVLTGQADKRTSD
jgi:hypothetical protein